MQNRSSKETSINKTKLPEIYNVIDFNKYKTVLDYGCGRYTEHIKKKMENTNCKWYGYDPYWDVGIERRAELVICSNVLNVIDDDDTLIEVINRLFNLGKEIVIKIYEGPEANGVGRETKPDQWQRNEKTQKYLDLIRKLGYKANKKGNYIYGVA